MKNAIPHSRDGWSGLTGRFRRTVCMGLLAVTSLTSCMSSSASSGERRPHRNPQPVPTRVYNWSADERSFRDKCQNPLNIENSTDEKEQRLQRFLKAIEDKGGPDGKALVGFIREDMTVLRFHLGEMPPGFHGFYDESTETIHLNENGSDNELITTMIHELVHAYQMQKKAINANDNQKDIHFAMATELTAEAGAESIAIRIIHEMETNGHNDIWTTYKSSFPLYADMGLRYEMAYNNHKDKGHSAAAALATGAAFDQYFKDQDRLDFYNMKALTGAIIVYATSDSVGAYQDLSQTNKQAQAMADLPGEGNYSQNATALSEKDIFGTGAVALIISTIAESFEEYRKGNNTAVNDTTLEKYGPFAGLDFKAAYKDFADTGVANNIVEALLMQSHAQGVVQKYIEYRDRKFLEQTLRSITIEEPLIITPAKPKSAPQQRK